MADFEISVDDKTEPDYTVSDNIAENLVDVIRSDMVGNEAQFLAINAAYASGLSRVPDEYIQIVVKGKSGEGKTEVKQNVDIVWPNHWLLRAGSSSDQGMVDADSWDNSYIGAFAELQQIQGKMLEMVKSCVTPDHDVLTPEGVVNITDVEVGDEVLSWDDETGRVCVKEVENTHHYPDFSGYVEKWDTRDVSLTMTAEHRVPISVGGRGGGFEETRVGNIEEKQLQLPSGRNGLSPSYGNSFFKIDLHNESSIRTETKNIDGREFVRYDSPSDKIDRNTHSWVPRKINATAFSRLCAWYITEGSSHYVEDGKNGGSNITITQSVESDYNADIMASLDGCGIDYTQRVEEVTEDKRDNRNVDNHSDKKKYTITNSVIHDVLTSMCGSGAENKKIPKWVFDLHYTDREKFRKELFKGDGDERDTSYRYSTISNQLRDDMLRLGFENALTANYTTEERKKENHNNVHRIRFNEDWQNVHESDKEVVKVDNGVYCLEVEDTGSFITGRDGNFSVTYNSAGDDADERGIGFTHTRNVDDGDGGRTDKEIEKQAMPTVFLFADENNAEIPKELRTRQMEIRVESDQDINRAVAKTMFDHKEVEVKDRDYEYNFNFDDGKNAVKNHISNIPRPLNPLWDDDPKNGYSYPVVIPHDENIEWPVSVGDSDTYGWDCFKVIDDILSYKKTQSKRGAKAIGNHIRSWTRMNYHNRETMDINGVTHYVADPQDVGNVLAYRDLLLAVTHDMNEQKLAVIEALTDDVNGVGGMGPNGGMQATHMDIREYIDEYADITTPSKSQLTNQRDGGILDQMEEGYLIEVHEGEGENGAHLYEFLGGNTFGHPNLKIYEELFSEVTDPIRDQPIEETVAQMRDELSGTTVDDLMGDDPIDAGEPTSASDDAEDGLSAFGDDDNGNHVEWTEVDHSVAERLQEAIDDCRATPDDIDSLGLTHMLDISPIEYYTDDRGLRYVRAERPRDSEDITDTLLDSSHFMWGDVSNGQVETKVENSVAKLRKHDVFEVDDEGQKDGHKYLLVSDLE